MLLKRFYDVKLAQASYLIGCQQTGDAIVIDPNRDIEQYVSAATSESVRITHVTETHIHADFVSGSRELAERSAARLHLSGEGGDDWRYSFAEAANARELYDGDIIDVGRIRLEARHTPGHTPEHLCFLITDTAATDRVMGALTGDFIFVGDVGRPDLLERAAKQRGTMDAGAAALFASIQRFKRLPDYLQLWPGHGAGSACGKALGAVPSTTLGYERIANWALSIDDEAEFARRVLAGQPEPPKYFAQMKRINKEGPRMLGGFTRPPLLGYDALPPLLARKAVVVDARAATTHAAKHVPGTLNIPLNKSFTTWAGALLPFDRDVHLIATETSIDEAVRDLAMIGLDRLAGWFTEDVVAAWIAQGGSADVTPQMSVHELEGHIARGDVTVIDVRGASEYAEGHIADAPNIPLAELPDRLAEIPSHLPIVLHCQGGGRSAIAASVLKANGFSDVANLTGGYGEWIGSDRG